MATFFDFSCPCVSSGKMVWNILCTASFHAKATTKARAVVKNVAERNQKLLRGADI
jgi:hypothetical protein